MAGSLEGNKLLAAVLTAGIIGVGSSVFAGILYHPHQLEEPVYVVEAAAEAGGEEAATAAEAQPIGALLASASAENGAKAAKKCAACHSFDKGGANKVGPNLWGIVDRPVAAHEGFSYSSGMKAFAEGGKKWDYQLLSDFLLSPKAEVKGTAMGFAGLKKIDDRANVLAYLRTLADTPVPLPQ